VNFQGEPLIAHVIAKLQGLGDECIVSIGGTHDAEQYRRVLHNNTLVVEDTVDFHGPLAGFMTALNECKSNACFLAACDMPLIEPKVVQYLFTEGSEHSSAVPRWQDGRLEPLHAVYDCKTARMAAQAVISERVWSMISLVDHMTRVRFVNVEQEISPINPTLSTFRNLNTPRELQDMEGALNRKVPPLGNST
jgi:molybdopterin-guanine dinucleotide biosynthesis protein A